MKKLIFTILVSTSALATTIIPFERDYSRIKTPAYIMSHNHDSINYTSVFVGDEADNLFYHGFDIQNMGPNEIVPTTPEGIDYANRDWSFVTDDKARKDTYLWLTDYNGSGYMSDFYETIIVFLPRENQFHVEETENELLVTLNTGEEVQFSKKTKAIIGGVIKESPVDFNPTRSQRKFAGLEYNGKGIMIRSDVRANDPRLTPTLQIIKKGLKPCKVASEVFWTQEGFPKFKYITDEEAYTEIKKHCGSEYLP